MHRQSSLRTRLVRGLGAATATVALASALTACGGDAKATASSTSDKVTIGAVSNGAAQQAELKVPVVEALRAQLPEAVRSRGELVIGVGALPSGYPPLTFVGSDQKTFTGSEPDLARLVAATLGLKPVIKNSTWENLFVGIDSGKVDVAFTNVTVTEERKKKYDFASYRQDNLAFEALKDNPWNFGGDYRNLAGKTVAVGSGTNQERILLAWQKKLQSEGKDLTVKYFPDNTSINLALAGKKIDLYFGPNPSLSYHITQTASGTAPTRNAGAYSGAGETLQGLIGATAKKDSGLAKPIAEAINHLVQNGQYGQLLTAWNLSNEAVTTSEVNPPGLPATNS
ncbi:ABC transporter substrate-binding protein [Streptomyces subrutilus]|uniref:ABC transporter substrate-binding protein n=1 Tax=Streptomyces subrutilus TaxID=36818 RepID=A0A5P2UQY0_9ACTN|nr:ABC transporter substrate-binding protein [Streptomyces subrutilus]QEU81702.1 ABC transporter substrate-binding protein [Streptomyces subrutilus]WSJ28876.1 ABC transporter substrate-binding protein [Streptomyces subrutilus]GGZ80514.1 putative amino acid ABC transporter, substrate-binding protein [Streptomyces subrutilus]